MQVHYTKDRVANVVLLMLIVACIVAGIGLVVKSKSFPGNKEHFAETATTITTATASPTNQAMAQLEQYGIVSLEEAKQLVNGTWNENWAVVPKNGVTMLYYSVFSATSREGLQASPYTWKNISPIFEQKLPENCKVDDSKIVFLSSAFAANEAVLGMTMKGIELNNNKANGPLAMNMGLNVTGAATQRFSIAFLLRFNSLSSFAGQTTQDRVELLNMRANTSNNNGIKISLDLTNKTLPENYRVNVRTAFGNSADITLIDSADGTGGVNIKAIPNTYYMLVLTRTGTLLTMAMYGIDASSTDTPYLVATKDFAFQDVVDFSNMPMQLSGGAFNVANLMAFSVCLESMVTKDMIDLASYWKAVIVKTGAVSNALSQQVLTLSACPFGDPNVCEACTSTDWMNISSVITGTDACRKAYDTYCTSNSADPSCECYSEAATSNQQCASWKNLVKGASSCTQTELDEYMRKNIVYTSNNNVPTDQSSLYNPLGRIRDFVAAEDYDTYTTASRVKVPTFWEWLFNVQE